MAILEVICAECGKKMEEKEATEEGKTHGICLKCRNAFNERERLTELTRKLARHPLK